MREKIELIMARKYFFRRMKKVFITRKLEIDDFELETFRQYLREYYVGNEYCYTMYSLMGLKDDDALLIGDLYIDKYQPMIYRGTDYCLEEWVEFTYKGKEYVFNSRRRRVETKDEWYEKFNPHIRFKYTKEDIVRNFRLQQINQSSYRVKESNILFYTENPYINGILIFDKKGEMLEFIAYSDPVE